MSSYVQKLKDDFGITYLGDCVKSLVNFLLWAPRMLGLADKAKDAQTIGDLIKKQVDKAELEASIDCEMDSMESMKLAAEDTVNLDPDNAWPCPDFSDMSGNRIEIYFDDIDVNYMAEGKRKSIKSKGKVEQIKAVRKVTGWGLKDSRALIDAYHNFQ